MKFQNIKIVLVLNNVLAQLCQCLHSQYPPCISISSSFDIQEEQLNCVSCQDSENETFLFSSSASSSRRTGRGEKTLFQIHCVQEGGRVMRTGRFCDSLIDLPEPAPSYHFSTAEQQYNCSTKVQHYQSTTLPLYQSKTVHQYQSTSIPQYHSL